MSKMDIQKEQLYRDYHEKVFGYIFSRINEKDNAEDLTSEVFLKVYDRLDDFDENKASLSTWIYTITRNTLIDFYRTRKIFEEVPETVKDSFSVETAILNNEMLDILADALESLEEKERKIIVLRFYSGKTLKEIAEGLEISYAYVKVLQNKAFEKIKKHFSN